MALKIVGVRAVVQNFNKYMGQINAVTKAATDSSKKISNALEHERLITKKLEMQKDDLIKKIIELIAKQGLGADATRKAVNQYDLLVNRLEKVGIGIDDLKDALGKAEDPVNILLGSMGKLGGVIKGAIEAFGGLGLAVEAIVSAISSVVTGPVGAIIAGIIIVVAQIVIFINMVKMAIKVIKFIASVLKNLAEIIAKIVVGAIKVLVGITKILVSIFSSLAKLITNIVVGAFKILMNIITGVATLIARTLTGAIKIVVSVISGLVKAAWDAGTAILRGLGNAIKEVASFILDVATRAFESLANAISKVIDTAWEGAAAFQKLRIRFQGLVANELLAGDATLEFDEAMQQAAYHGARLLGWVQELALTTPFTRKDIGDTVAFAMAMGFTAKEAQDLTLAIGDFVSGMGLSSDTMERIILQFGQMQAGGRLFGTELRDLARGAFVPVNEIIKDVAESLEMTAEEWQYLAARGETDITPFFDKFMEMAEKRFPNAMARMNKTLEAVMQNFGEFAREILGVRAFGPMVDTLSSKLSDMFSQLAGPKVLAAFSQLGQSLQALMQTLTRFGEVLLKVIFGTSDLGKIAQAAAGALAAVADQIRGFVRSLISGMVATRRFGEDVENLRLEMKELRMEGKKPVEMPDVITPMKRVTQAVAVFYAVVDKVFAFIAKVAYKAAEVVAWVAELAVNITEVFNAWVPKAVIWGANLIIGFAKGMAEAATTALVWVMQQINALLTHWLSGHSPPLVAPEIDQWGADAMTEWLEGFTEADFDILKGVTSPLRQALDTLVSAELIDEGEMRKIMLGVYEGLAEGLSMDQIGAGVYAQIAGLGRLGQEINELIGLQLDLAAATDAVRRAEEALERARQRYADAVIGVMEETARYNKLLRGGAGQKILDAQLKRVNAAEMEREIAQEQIGVAEENLQVAQDALDPLQEQVNLQQQLIDQLLEIMRLKFPAAEGLGKGLKGAAGAAGELAEEVDEAVSSLDALSGTLGGVGGVSEIFNTMREIVGDLFVGVGDRWDETVAPALDTLGSAFETAYEDIGTAWEENVASIDFEGIFSGIEKAWSADVTPAVSTLITTFNTFMQTAVNPLIAALVGGTTGTPGAMGVPAGHGGPMMVSHGGGMLGALSSVAGGAQNLASVIWTELQNAFGYLVGTGIPQIQTALVGSGKEGASRGGLLGAIADLIATIGISWDPPTPGYTLASALHVVVDAATAIIDALANVIRKIQSTIEWVKNLKEAWSKPAWEEGPLITPGSAITGESVNRAPQAIGHQRGAWRVLHEDEMVLPAGIASQIRGVLTARVYASPAMSTTNNNNSVQFGDVSVGNQMDMMMLQLAVEGALRNAL